jgi:hypothetical protein
VWIFLQGNLSEGFKAIGPFANADECAEKCDGVDGWMMKVETGLTTAEFIEEIKAGGIDAPK